MLPLGWRGGVGELLVLVASSRLLHGLSCLLQSGGDALAVAMVRICARSASHVKLSCRMA